jgi:hypothetical protein
MEDWVAGLVMFILVAFSQIRVATDETGQNMIRNYKRPPASVATFDCSI